jgi:hypothetical protein
MNISRPSPAARRSLLPSEIVRPKSVQVVKFDRVVVARRMQHHAVRRRARLFVADLGVTRETSKRLGEGARLVKHVGNVADDFHRAPAHLLPRVTLTSLMGSGSV